MIVSGTLAQFRDIIKDTVYADPKVIIYTVAGVSVREFIVIKSGLPKIVFKLTGERLTEARLLRAFPTAKKVKRIS